MNPYLHINRLEFVLTDHCTGRCKHCSVGERVAHPRREHHVPRQAAEQAIRFLADEYDMASVMTFGGEPLLYPAITCAIGTPRRWMPISTTSSTPWFRSMISWEIRSIARFIAALSINRVFSRITRSFPGAKNALPQRARRSITVSQKRTEPCRPHGTDLKDTDLYVLS